MAVTAKATWTPDAQAQGRASAKGGHVDMGVPAGAPAAGGA